jgi:energy-coupling factor transporter transmembrane protein EcfT
MEQEIRCKEKSVLAKIAFISWLFGVASLILFCFFVTIGLDFGILALLPIVFFPFALLAGVISVVVILFFHRSLGSLVYSFLAIILSFPAVYIMTEFFMSPNVREYKKKNYTALYNMELLAKELKKYAKNHDGYLPDANNWCDALMKENPELTPENFRFPQPEFIGLKGKYHIAFNRNIGGKLLKNISKNTVLLFESDGDWNQNGTAELLNNRYGEAKFVSILFVDGSESDYWFDKQAVRKFKGEFGGGASMYYEQPRWEP